MTKNYFHNLGTLYFYQFVTLKPKVHLHGKVINKTKKIYKSIWY